MSKVLRIFSLNYKQVEGAAMGSTLSEVSPIVANLRKLVDSLCIHRHRHTH